MKFCSLSRLVITSFLLTLSLSAMAAQPANDDLSGRNDEATWTGGPYYASNPSGTLGLTKQHPCDVGQPACDNFRLTVSGSGVKQVLIAIAPAAGFETDDYDLHVYNDQGVRIASDAGEDGYESVVIDTKGTSAYYDVRVQPWLVGVGSSYSGVAQPSRGEEVDVVTECLELIPEDVGVPIVDSGQRVELSVMLLLDGTTAAVARQLMTRAAESYRPLNIDLVLSRTRQVTFTSTVSTELIAAAKAEVGGKPPNGIDVVGVFTTKTMQAATGGAGTVVGQADCIGGIR